MEEEEVIEIPKLLADRIEQFTLEIPTTPYDEMIVLELKELCRKKGLKLTGLKSDLISRLNGEEADN